LSCTIFEKACSAIDVGRETARLATNANAFARNHAQTMSLIESHSGSREKHERESRGNRFRSRQRHRLWRACGRFPATVVFRSFTLIRAFLSLPAPNDSEGRRVETIRLTHAVKNTWERRRLPGLNDDPDG
jgi:hypothetical protein